MNKFFLMIAALCGPAVLAQETATVNRARVNVRGGPTLTSEVVAQLKSGDKVTVIEEIVIEKPKPGEPAKWSAIKLPESTRVWVFNDFIRENTVAVNRLNLRAGPGENFSVVGRLEKGAKVAPIRVVEQWTEVEAPETARAYVDSSYLDRSEKLNVYEPPAKPEEAKTVAEASKPEVAPAVKSEAKPQARAAVAEAKPEVAPEPARPLETAVVKEEPKPAPAKVVEETKPPHVKVAEQPKVEPAPAAPAQQEPAAASAPVETPPEATRVLPEVAKPVATTNIVMMKRIVRREGIVRSTKLNIQAPTYFELIGEKGKVLNFLNAEKTGFKLKDYRNLRVMVTGEESIDPRFPNTPLLEIETIEVAP